MVIPILRREFVATLGGAADRGAGAASGGAGDRVPSQRVVRSVCGPPAQGPPRAERNQPCRESQSGEACLVY
jgi:hypothetical protein